MLLQENSFPGMDFFENNSLPGVLLVGLTVGAELDHVSWRKFGFLLHSEGLVTNARA